jgi:hypothetical protein
MRQGRSILRIEAEQAQVPHSLTARQGKLAAPQRNKMRARHNKAGPVQADGRLGTSDEPVQTLARPTGQQGSRRARQIMGAGGKTLFKGPVPLSGSVGAFPTGSEQQNTETRNRTGIDGH